MRCPFCKTDSIRPVSSGETEIDQCASCEAAWFDSGKIRELTEGRFPGNIEPKKESDLVGGKKKTTARMSRAWVEAAFLFCLRCSRQLAAIDFQNTGTPVFHCRECGGMLASRNAVEELAGKFDFLRKHAAAYQALGESMASQMQDRLNLKYDIDPEKQNFLRGGSYSLDPKVLVSFIPIVIPLKDEMKQPESHPVVTFGLLFLMISVYLFCFFGIAGADKYLAWVALPSGTGLVSAPQSVLLAPFFHGGFIPLVVGCLFLYVLGDDVEDRMGRIPFFFFYLACGVVAGVIHILLGKAGASSALGSAGAVAGVLGAYVVFFPHVPITVYRAGEIVSMPAYFLACMWVMAQFVLGWLPLSDIFNPAPYSIVGNLGGLAAGAVGAIFWQSMTES